MTEESHSSPSVHIRRRLVAGEIRDAVRLRGWIGLSIIWAAGIILMQFFPSTWVWGGAAFVALVFWFANRSWEPDAAQICRGLEKRNPEIEDVLSALAELDESDTGIRGVIRERLEQSVIHARSRASWKPLIGREDLALAGVVQTAFLLGLLFPLWKTVVWDTPRPQLVKVFESYGIRVSPGNAEVEKGTSVPVIARFKDDAVPDRAWLEVVDIAGQTNRLELAKNLNDPVFGTNIPDIQNDSSYRVIYDGRSQGPYRLTVFEFPLLVRADARLSFPDHMDMEDKLISDTLNVTAMEGTALRYEFYANKPLESAMLVEQPRGRDDQRAEDERLKIALLKSPDNPLLWTWETELQDSAKYRLVLEDDKGRRNKLYTNIRIEVIRNEKPKFRWTRPGNDIEVTPIEELSLAATVEDDMGLTGHGLIIEKPGADPRELTFSADGKIIGPGDNGDQPAAGAPATTYAGASLEHVLNMEAEEVESGDMLVLAAWADDLDASGQKRRSYSDLFFITVREFEEIFRQGQNQQQNQQQQQQQSGQQSGGPGGEILEIQKNVITATWNTFKGGRDGDIATEAAVIRESQQQALQMFQMQLAEMNPTEDDVPVIENISSAMETAIESLRKAETSQSLADLRSAIPSENSALQGLNRFFDTNESEVSQSQSNSGGGGQSSRSQAQLNQMNMRENENNYQTQSQAQAAATPEQEARLDVLDKLRDLAQRQLDLNERLQELEAALREASTEEEKEKIRRELQKLQEEQRELMRGLDEAEQRMAEAPTREMQETRRQLDQARQSMEQIQEAINEGQLTQARNEGTRAEQTIDELRRDFRERSASEFTDEIRDLANRTRELDQRQQQINDQIKELEQSTSGSLSGSQEEQQLAESMNQQTESLEQILEQMQRISEESESVEPLLSEALYDTLRKVSQDQLSEAMESARDLVERGLLTMADDFNDMTEEGMSNLVSGVQEAVEKVLGDESAALETASRQLERLREDLESEVRQLASNQQEGGDESQPGTSRQGGEAQDSPQGQQPGSGNPRDENQQTADGRGQSQEPGEGQGQGRPDDSESDQQMAGGQGQAQQPQDGQQGGGQGQQSRQPGQNQDAESQRRMAGGQSPGQNQNPQDENPRSQPGGGGGGDQPFFLSEEFLNGGGGMDSPRTTGPLTGELFQQWSRSLEEVEDMVFDEELSNRAAQINERARQIRREFKRNGKEPQWDLVRLDVLEPMVELKQLVDEALALRRSEETELVPVDRDPVPTEFSRWVDRYYQRLSEVRQATEND